MSDDLHLVLKRLNEDALRVIAARAMERTANEDDILQGIRSVCEQNDLLKEPYNACQSAFHSDLITGLVRMYDTSKDPRNVGLQRLINLLSASAESLGVDTEALARACQQFNKLKGDQRLQRLRTRRHQHLAHTAVEIIEPQKLAFGDARTFADDTLDLLRELNLLVTGRRKNFARSVESWRQLAEAFWRQFGNGG